MLINRDYWRTVPGPKLLQLITAVSAIAISYEGMSQGVMGAVQNAPEFGVCDFMPPSYRELFANASE
jgi:hypothetical protein